MWEDYRNKRGGRWLLSLAKQQRHTELDRLWLETVSGGKGAGVGLQREVVSKLVGWTLTIPPLGPVAMSAGGEFRGIQPGGVWSRCQHPHQGGQDCCVDK